MKRWETHNLIYIIGRACSYEEAGAVQYMKYCTISFDKTKQLSYNIFNKRETDERLPQYCWLKNNRQDRDSGGYFFM